MMSYPLSLVEAQVHMKRLKSDRSSIVGSHGHYFVKEERTIKCKNGIEADIAVMHGRSIGRHTYSPHVKRETVHPKPRVLA